MEVPLLCRRARVFFCRTTLILWHIVGAFSFANVGVEVAEIVLIVFRNFKQHTVVAKLVTPQRSVNRGFEPWMEIPGEAELN